MSDCTRTTTGIAPLDDIAAGQYQGADRGLYPGSSNTRPEAHTNLGRYYAGQIEPLDDAGVPDSSGKIGFVGLGFSGGKLVFDALMPLIAVEPHVHPSLVSANCCVAGRDSADLADPTNGYWTDTFEVNGLLAAGGLTHAQVQAAVLFSGRQLPGYAFPTNVDALEADLIGAVQQCLANFPKLKILYITCIPYGNYAGPSGEPHDFEQCFAFKRLIERQINHDPAVECRESPQTTRVAPYLTWGFYPWCDGMNPRPSDGMIWRCGGTTGDVKSDGHHPSVPNGAPKLAAGWVTLFRGDITTRGWFYESATGTTPPPPSGGGGTPG